MPCIEEQRRAVKILNFDFLSLGNNGLADFVSGSYGHIALPAQVKDAAIQMPREDAATALAWAKSLPPDRRAQAVDAVEREL